MVKTIIKWVTSPVWGTVAIVCFLITSCIDEGFELYNELEDMGRGS